MIARLCDKIQVKVEIEEFMEREVSEFGLQIS